MDCSCVLVIQLPVQVVMLHSLTIIGVFLPKETVRVRDTYGHEPHYCKKKPRHCIGEGLVLLSDRIAAAESRTLVFKISSRQESQPHIHLFT